MQPGIIRQLSPYDAEAWAATRRDALVAHPLAFGASPPDDLTTLVETARDRLAVNEHAAVYGAFVDGVLIGTVGIRRNMGLKERHKAWIWGMYVAESARSRGIGAALMEAAIESARKWPGVEQVQLAVSEAAPEAHRLYRRLGFREWGREPRALCVGGTSVDEFHMWLDLKAE